MSGKHKRLLEAMERHQPDCVHDVLKELSSDEKTYLLSRKRPLLDEAASKSHMDIMAILIENGITKWRGWKDNNLMFVGLLQSYYEEKDNDGERISTEQMNRLAVLKCKHNSKKTTTAIKTLLETQASWLVSRMREPARVEVTAEHLGRNISWSIMNGIESAEDYRSGRKLQMDQKLFRKPVKLIFSVNVDEDEDEKEWTVDIEGTTQQVFEKIHSELKTIMEDENTNFLFAGLSRLPKRGYLVCTEH